LGANPATALVSRARPKAPNSCPETGPRRATLEIPILLYNVRITAALEPPGSNRRIPAAKTSRAAQLQIERTKSALLHKRIEMLTAHFAKPDVLAAIDKKVTETFTWLKRNKERRNKEENRLVPWWPMPSPTKDKYLLRNRKQQLLFTAYGNGLWWTIEQLIIDGHLLANEKHDFATALGYVPFALHHELIGMRLKNDSLSTDQRDPDNWDGESAGLNDIAIRFDYDNASNMRDTYVDVMQTFGLWDVRYPDARYFEIRIGPVAYAFHMHALVPILEELEPTL